MSNTPIRALALDHANRCGWAATGERLHFGAEVFAGAHGARFVAFTDWLAALADEHRPTVIVAEAPSFNPSGRDVAKLAWAWTTRAEELASRRGIEFRQVAATTVKLWATGSGAADKEAMRAAAIRRAGLTGIEAALLTYDEADAICLALYAAAGFPTTETQAERKKRETRERKAAA